MTTRAKPEIVTDDHLAYLDMLRESGATNMSGAGPYVQREFSVDRKAAREIVLYWMESFAERHPR
jgi:uncharacterized protein YciI